MKLFNKFNYKSTFETSVKVVKSISKALAILAKVSTVGDTLFVSIFQMVFLLTPAKKASSSCESPFFNLSNLTKNAISGFVRYKKNENFYNFLKLFFKNLLTN